MISNEELMKKHTDLVYFVAKRMGLQGDPDAIQEGFRALIIAGRRFDESKGYEFSTFAVPYIQGYMARFKHLDKVITDRKIGSKYECSPFVDSFERRVGEDDSEYLGDFVPSEIDEDSMIDAIAMRDAVNGLDEKLRKVWDLRVQGVTNEEIGKMMGYSTSTAEYYVKKAAIKVAREYYGNR